MSNDATQVSSNPHILEQAVTGYRALSRSLQVFLIVDLTLLAVAGVIEAICRYLLHLGHPYNSPLLWEYFPDIVNNRPRFQYFHTLQFFTDKTDQICMYPAPVAVLYRLIYLFRPYDLAVFLSFAVLCFLVATFLFWRSLLLCGLDKRAAITLLSIALLSSYPLWYELKQANMEIVVWLLVTTGIWCFLSGRGGLAATCIGVAGAMKIFPFVYLGLFLARRQYRHLVVSLIVAVAVTIPALWLVYPHIPDSWRLTNEAVTQFRSIATLHIRLETGSDHSIFALIKRAFHLAHLSVSLSSALTAYLATAAFGGLALYFFFIRKTPVINQVLCLCIASIVLPPTSFDYTLMHLYVPWALLVLFAVRAESARRNVAGLTAAFVCFAILFVPETEFIFHAATFGGQIKCCVLIALLVIALRYPFDSKLPGAIQSA